MLEISAWNVLILIKVVDIFRINIEKAVLAPQSVQALSTKNCNVSYTTYILRHVGM